MTHRSRGTRWLPAIAAVALLAACGDSTDVVTDYDPQETLDRLDAVVEPLDLGFPALDAFQNVGDYFYDYGAAPVGDLLRVTAVRPLRHGLPDPAVLREVAARRLAAPAADAGALPKLAFPSAVLGETLVWDPIQDWYVVDPDRSGAPTNGVRAIYYTTDDFGYPITPLDPVGYIDFTDEDRTLSERVGVRVVEYGSTSSQDREVADFAVELAASGSSSAGTIDLALSGVTSPGNDVLELDLVQRFTWNEAQNYDRVVLDYLFDSDEGPVRFTVNAEMPFEGVAWTTTDFEVLFGTAGSNAVEVSIGIDSAERLSGGIRKGGTLVIEVSGTDGNPTFTRARGGTLTNAEISTLEYIWIGISNALVLVDWLMLPADLLFLPN